MRVLIVVALLFLAQSSQAGQAVNTLQIAVRAPLSEFFSPAAPTIDCNTAPGTVVAAVSTSGGNGKPISLVLSGDTTDFALSATILPANVIVGPAGIAAANCGTGNTPKMDNVTVTANQ